MSTASPASSPKLSVVVASVNGWDVLGPTLDALDRQPDRGAMEVVVVEPADAPAGPALRGRTPAVRVVEVDRREAIPRLRAHGVKAATAPIVAILEDHGAVGPGWSTAVLNAHRGDAAAVGGPVANGRGGLVNWAAFFCEYSAYMPSVPEGDWHDLPGNNIAYKRPHLMRHVGVLEGGQWESWINDRLRAEGERLVSTNTARVDHIKTFRFWTYLRQRYLFSRSYAGMRRPDQSWPKRLIYGFGSAALPLMITARIAKNALRKRYHLGRFFQALPLIVLFQVSGAAGEMIGYLIGPGDSLDHVD